MLAFFGTLLFGLTAFRNALPGAPPAGTFSDYLAFFWAYAVVIVAIGRRSAGSGCTGRTAQARRRPATPATGRHRAARPGATTSLPRGRRSRSRCASCR